jgi:hypothetical protein
LRPPFGLTTAPATYWGVAGVVGCWYLPGGVKMERATGFYKIGQKIAIPLKATDRLGVFFLLFFQRPLHTRQNEVNSPG